MIRDQVRRGSVLILLCSFLLNQIVYAFPHSSNYDENSAIANSSIQKTNEDIRGNGLRNNPFFILSDDETRSIDSRDRIEKKREKKRQYRFRKKAKALGLQILGKNEDSHSTSLDDKTGENVSSRLLPLLKESFEKASEVSSSKGPFSLPKGAELLTFSMLIPGVAAAAENASDAISTHAPIIDSTIACIVARELTEGAMFTASHIGAIIKHPKLSPDEKRYYMKGLVPAIICGVVVGGGISVGVGFTLAQTLANIDDVSNGVELGEAISKTIGAWFVTKMTLKIPRWFGISNFYGDSKVGDSENKAPGNKNQEAEIGSRLAMSLSLFWNILREATEGGVLTAITALLSKNSMDALGASVGVGVGSAALLSGGMALGAKYVSAKGFGAVAAGIAELLAMGLITGAVRSYEEVYAEAHNGETTPIIYDMGETKTGDILSAFEFMGISDHLTALQLATWIGSAATITGLHIWHNYLGKPLIPSCVKNCIKSAKSTIVAPFKYCWNHLCHPYASHEKPAIEMQQQPVQKSENVIISVPIQ